MGDLVCYKRNGMDLYIINTATGEAMISLVLSPHADVSLNSGYVESVSDVAERYLGYLNKNDCKVAVPYKNFTAIGVDNAGNHLKAIRVKATGEVMALVREYHTEPLFNLALEFGVGAEVERYCSAINKRYDKARKEAMKKQRRK